MSIATERQTPVGEIKLENQRCDFCSLPRPGWRFPANSFIDKQYEVGLSVGDWAACEQCAALIQTEDWIGLARRTVTVSEAGRALVAIAGGEEQALGAVEQLQQQFRSHRKGPGSRISPVN